MTAAIIVGHQDMSSGLVGAVESITGPLNDICSLSNRGLSTKELADKIRECACSGNQQTLIFVDIYGGSCWRAAKMAQVQDWRILTGVNLPMLLSFVNKRNQVPLEDLPAVLAEDAKRGIIIE